MTCRCRRSIRAAHSSTSSCPRGWSVYTYGPKNYQIVVNGYTGAIAGDRPISYVKVFFYIILPVLIVLLLVFFTQQ